MATQWAIDPNTNEKVQFGVAVNENGETVTVELQRVPPTAKIPSAKLEKEIQGVQESGRGDIIRQQARKRKKYDEKLEELKDENLTDYEKALRAEIASDGFLDRAMIAAGKETSSLVEGAKDLATISSLALGDLYKAQTKGVYDLLNLGGNFSVPNIPASAINYAQQKGYENMAERNARHSALAPARTAVSEEAGLPANLLGGSLPYVLSGTALSRPAAVAGQQATRILAAPPVQGYQAGRGLLGKAVDAATESTNPILNYFGNKAKREITDPARAKISARRARNPIRDPHYIGNVDRTLGSGLLGAAEGGLHKDIDMIEGSLYGLTGGAGSQLFRPKLTRQPMYWDEHQKELVKRAEQYGFRLSPGMKTGNSRQQQFEAEMRNSEFMNLMKLQDDHNRHIFNRESWKAAGLDTTDGVITPKKLREHKNSMKAEYQELLAGTRGFFGKRAIARLKRKEQELSRGNTDEAKKAHKAFKQHLADLERLFPQRGRRVFKGVNFQKEDIKLKDAMQGAYKRGDMATYWALKEIRNELGKAVENGLANKYKGHTGIAKWQDLNERWAMTRLLQEEGSDILLNADPKKLESYMMANDVERTLFEQGNRIKPLQDMAKVNKLLKQQRGSAFGARGLIPKERGPSNMAQAFLTSNFWGRTPIIPKSYHAMYMSGWPGTTGLLGLSGKNAGEWTRYGRAAEMSRADDQGGLLGLGIKGLRKARDLHMDWKAGKTEEQLEELRKILYEQGWQSPVPES